MTSCYGDYSILEEEDDNYCVGWDQEPCPNGDDIYNISYAAWKHVSSADNWGLPKMGIHSTYGGGGYIADLFVNFKISKQMLSDLHNYMWIDRKTRAVFIEMTLYNVDDNVFIYISLLCEFPETGGVFTSTSIKPFRPYQHVGTLGVFTFLCEILALIGMLIFSVRKVINLYRYGKQILKDIWNILDIFIILLFFVCTALYLTRWIMIDYAMKKFGENKNKFVNFSHIAYWDELFNIVLATIIFLISLRLMKVLSYNRRVNRMGYIFSHVSRDLCGCLIMFLIIYLAFVVFGHLIFGRQLETYKSLFVSSTTLTNAIIGKNSINDIFTVEPIIGRAYYFLFVFFLLWIMMTMLNATLNVGISKAKSDLVKRTTTYGLTNYVMRLFADTIGMFLPLNNNVKKKTRSHQYKMFKNKSAKKDTVKVYKRKRPPLIYMDRQ